MPTLGTGTDIPIGPEIDAEDIYIEGGPDIWFQDATANPQQNPDSDGFYWGLSGTAAYPVYELGCYDDLSIADSRTSNPVTCAALGNVRQMQRRDALEISLTFKSLLPFETLRHIMGLGAVTHNAVEETSKMGIGNLPQNTFFHMWLARVYDEDLGDYVGLYFDKVQFMDANPLTMAYGKEWTVAVKAMALANSARPKAQRFGMMLRYDPSVL
ncbi:MAG: hypothetical protein A2V88_08870 [Elusimicrobia bacterium RBG_16_66_12]|nr:MAG: hypothetical protein A2V88_08870 [Elusimicrobia bacterium RBG_16_66_12]